MIANLRTTMKGLIAAFVLMSAAGPAAATSDDAQDVDKMRAAVAENAEKAVQQQGGSHIALKVDASALREVVLMDLRDDVFRIVHEERIPFSGLALREGGIDIRIAEATDRERLLSKLEPPPEATRRTVAITDGGDGLIRLAPTEAAFGERQHELVRQSIEMIEQLLRNEGIRLAGLLPDGPDGIRLVLPGVTDPERISTMLTRKRRVAFRLVDLSMTPQRALKGSPPSESEILYGFKDKTPYLLLKDVALDGGDLSDVAPGLDSATHEPIASFRFNARGARRFGHVTGENIGRPFAIVVDDTVLSASVIREPIRGGSGQISGGLTLEDANNIAMLLRSGTLPGRLSLVDQQVVEGAK